MSEYIFVILLGIPAEHEQRFNDVYENDHLPNILKVQGVSACTRYRLEWSENADMGKYVAIYHIAERDLPRSADWKKQAGLGAWSTEIRPLVTTRSSGVFHRIFQTDGVPGGDLNDSTDSDFIYFLQQSVPEKFDEQFNHLYNTDHIPFMLKAAGAKSCTRYNLDYSDTNDIPGYLTIYATKTVDAPRSVEWKHQTTLGAWPQMRPNFTARRNGGYRRLGVFRPK